ncbi:hypothetical protein HHK36_011499 [Tetracentron sinense]|uniref:Strictosidine synthase conserved region domain-containing protein n=1 Tax=Tetracentron sinense TaxID=13715 RepID=A0A835DJX8_TETSI|nr:hypothetical protein HHK36_011499 [Tetracentron sinense]
MTPAGILTGLFLLLALYCGIDPFKHSAISDFPDFKAYKIDLPPWSELPVEKDSENLLQKSEIRFLNQVQGPESITFDPLGRGPYTGVADGRILFWDGERWTDFAFTSSNRSELCSVKPSPLSYLKNEHICGRPLGLRFHKKTGELYIADAYLGLMKVGPEGGLATSLATEAEGVPLRFTNDLDIDDEGNVYFTDSSTKYQRSVSEALECNLVILIYISSFLGSIRKPYVSLVYEKCSSVLCLGAVLVVTHQMYGSERNFMQLVFSAEDSGRVLKYDPISKETSVLVQNLQFPNGLSLSKDRSFFVFCEGALGRLRKYWLKGEKVGTSEVFAILPGFPDNVRTNEKGEFWVAVHCRRTMYAYLCGIHPRIRKFLLKLPIPALYQFLLHIGGPHAVVTKYSPDGKLMQILEDSQGKVVKAVSEVEEKDGKLWMGSVLMPFVAVYHLD